ncbi:MAG TPA: hypothetical protein VF618_12760 [Thermoanaerobaculia bacterium]
MARAVSIAAHPLVLIPLTVALLTRHWMWALMLVATTLIPLTIVILFQMRRGTWSDFDVSRPEQRRWLYVAAVPLLVAAVFVLRSAGAPPHLLRGPAVSAVMMLIGILLSRWLKVSLHLLFGTFCAVALTDAFPLALPLAAAVLLALAWSRTRLKRHTWAEVAAGFTIGLGGGLWAVWA